MTSPEQTSAKAIIQAQLQQWGIDSLFGDLDRLIKEGLGPDAITLQLQQTDAYKTRFKGNELRSKAGLPVLSPAEYISAETSYRQVMQSYGLPATFYDQPDDYHDFLAKDISPDEVNTRAKTAQSIWLSNDQGTKDTWRDFYGLTDGAAIASILDPDKAMPIVERMATAAKLGGAAQRNGLTADKSRFEQYADLGVTSDQANSAFGQIGAVRDIDNAIASRFGTTFSQADAEQSRLVGAASARRKQAELYGSEQALFDTRAAADATSLTRRTSGGF